MPEPLIALPPVSPMEQAAIIAGLRLLQDYLIEGQALPPGIWDIYTNGDDRHPEMRLRALPRNHRDGFDELCERLNSHHA